MAKWVFRQGFSPIILNVAQYKNNTDSMEESVEMHNNLFLEETEAATGLERILGKKLMGIFKIIKVCRDCCCKVIEILVG